jgi:serine/threonine protein kinase
MTETELVNQGAYGCLYYPGMHCNGKTMDNLRYATKLVVHDEVAENEVAVGNIVKGIVNYGVNFVPVIDTCGVGLEKVRRHNPHALNKCDIAPKTNKNVKPTPKFMLMKMPYIDSLYFYDYVTVIGKNKKKIISCIFDTYSYLIESIERLGEHAVVHYDLKMQNILMNLKTDMPVIIDFGLSIPIGQQGTSDNRNDAFWTTYFYKYSPEYYVWPLEAHVINFLQAGSSPKQSLSRDDVVSICETCVNANVALRIFSKGFRTRYLQACIAQYEPWIGVARDAVRKALLKGWRTWDNYSLSIAYLQIIGFISETGFTNNHLIVQYVQLLLVNVHPDPERRKTVGDTKRTFTELFFMNERVDTYESLVENFNASMFAQNTVSLL